MYLIFVVWLEPEGTSDLKRLLLVTHLGHENRSIINEVTRMAIQAARELLLPIECLPLNVLFHDVFIIQVVIFYILFLEQIPLKICYE